MDLQKMKKTFIFSAAAAFLVLGLSAHAHQPRLVDEAFTEISNPEISQAFYGELVGEEKVFVIDSAEDFRLYVGVLVPDIQGIDKDISADVYRTIGDEDELWFRLDGTQYDWTSFHEEFAGDDYFKGPDRTEDAAAGIYTIKVSSPDNWGKFVLVVGEKEEFPPKEILNTVVVLPQLKMFFETCPYNAYFNRIGLMLLGLLIIVGGVVVLAVKVAKSIKKRKPTKK